MTETLRFPKPPPLTCSETEYQRWIVARAVSWGWKVNHTYRTRVGKSGWRTATTSTGFPDLQMVRNGYLVVAEVKAAKGKVEPDQDEWLDAFAEIPAPWCRVFVWYPADWHDVVEVLRP